MPTSSNNKIVLSVKGRIPSFKNCKRAILDRQSGKMRTMTDKKTQQRMEEIILVFVSQLTSVIRTTYGGTLTAGQLRSWIVSSLPQDDSWQWVPELTIRARAVDKGAEGATITIEKLADVTEPV